ncbi:MAG: sulfite exporter TauE/SafE family protein [Candidatus Buchananbacteria bacterium]|nr:sulfite exporter TauE/SafE family protein [Candidatus Buchananbacteria bacterium]
MENQNRQTTIYVSGMHCATCEILIEKKLLKKDGIESVDASLKNNQVNLVVNQNYQLNLSELNQELASLGYQFSHKPIGQIEPPLFSRNQSGQIKVNQEKLKKIGKNILLAGIFLLVFAIVEKMQLGRFISVKPGATLSAFFLLGVVAGLSSCAALIGGLLLSLTKHWHEQRIDAENGFQRAQPHLLFHLSRLLTFFLLGGVLGLVGDAISFNNTIVYSLLVLAISIVMLILALQMLGVQWAAKFSFHLPKSISRAAAKDKTDKNNLGPILAGGLTFFLPCGFTLIAQGVALASGSFLFGGLVMLYFAFGTLPVLLGISLSGLKLTSKPHLTARFSIVAGILILFFSFYNINGQLNVLGLPSLSDLSLLQTTQKNLPARPIESKTSEQTISLVAKGFNYIPNGATTIEAGKSTKLIVDNQGIQGCGSFLAARGLINGFVALKLGQNIIDLGQPRAGTYKITCSMGMVPPVTIKVQ